MTIEIELVVHIRKVMVGGNHLAASLINAGIIPNHILSEKHIDDAQLRDMWIAWKAIMELRDYLDDVKEGAKTKRP